MYRHCDSTLSPVSGLSTVHGYTAQPTVCTVPRYGNSVAGRSSKYLVPSCVSCCRLSLVSIQYVLFIYNHHIILHGSSSACIPPHDCTVVGFHNLFPTCTRWLLHWRCHCCCSRHCCCRRPLGTDPLRADLHLDLHRRIRRPSSSRQMPVACGRCSNSCFSSCQGPRCPPRRPPIARRACAPAA